MTATDAGSNVTTVTIPGGGSGITTQDEGILVDATATTLNFVGAGVTATDAGSNVTTVTIPGGGGGTSDALIIAYDDALDGTIAPEFTVGGAGTATFDEGGVRANGGAVSYTAALTSPQRPLCIRLLYRVASGTPPFSRITITNQTSSPSTMISLFWNAGANGDVIIFDHNSASTLATVIAGANDADKFFDVKFIFNPYSKRVKVFVTDLTDAGNFQTTGEGIYSGTCNSTDNLSFFFECGAESWIYRLEYYKGVQ